jgi:hypothetical protein
MKSKRVAIILAIVFLAGLFGFTVYSRSYAVRRLPLVHISMPLTADLAWSFDTRSTVRLATDEEFARGFEWAVDIVVPYESFRDTMSQLMGVDIELVADRMGYGIPGAHLHRRILDNYDVVIQIGFNHHGFTDDGDGVSIYLTLAHGAPVFDNLLPMSAIREDIFTGLPYVYTVERRDGAWGSEFFVERRDVQWSLPAEVGNLANVLNYGDSPVVFAEEAPIFHGARVRLFD